MQRQQRREFLKQTAAALGTCTIAGAWPSLLSKTALADSAPKMQLAPGYGPLLPATDKTTGMQLLKLPEGFEYMSYGWAGEIMDDGLPTPPLHDGMGMIRADERGIVLCRNHEITGDEFGTGPVDAMYDRRGRGGCTNVLFDPDEGKFVRSWQSLAGTVANCAGGTTPWGTWLTCEETVWGPGDKEDESSDPFRYERDHGWVFEVPAEGLANPAPIRDMGHFWHEAIAIDERTGIVYLTEDRNTAGLYRYLPNIPGQLASGGRLEMLRIKGVTDARKGVWNGEVISAEKSSAIFDVEWVPIEDPYRAHSPGTNDTLGVYSQGKQQQATTFARLEGCWYQDGVVYVVSTIGGDAECGQVWAYEPDEERIRLIFESPSSEILDMPDNVAVSPRGSIVLCEDSYLPVARMRGLTPDGKVIALADNDMQFNGELHDLTGDYRTQEWAGVTFSPDGKWMFVNIQTPGVTFAITGPWGEGLL